MKGFIPLADQIRNQRLFQPSSGLNQSNFGLFKLPDEKFDNDDSGIAVKMYLHQQNSSSVINFFLTTSPCIAIDIDDQDTTI